VTRLAQSNPLLKIKRVGVGSINGPKLAAVRSALGAYAPDVTVEGVVVDSGVPEQPVGFDEIIRGARNRAAGAVSGCSYDLGIGIEDGLIPYPVAPSSGEIAHLNIGCVAITDGERNSIGFSSAFAYPPACSIQAANDRQPIGVVFDRLWEDRRGESSRLPSALSTGNIGRLSNDVLPRAEYTRHGVLCALVAYLQPDLYGLDEDGT
jgi:inosine/xanthosine triphosphatase